MKEQFNVSDYRPWRIMLVLQFIIKTWPDREGFVPGSSQPTLYNLLYTLLYTLPLV